MDNCPYCGHRQEINHDDGYGYSEDVIYQQQCDDCDKFFAYTTCITFSYHVKKAECLNGDDHQWHPSVTYPTRYTKMYCATCGDSRVPTGDEMAAVEENLERRRAKSANESPTPQEGE